MKTAIYIDNGTVQLVLTPENKFEDSAMRMFKEKSLEANLYWGTFGDCNGGWVRMFNIEPERNSLMIRAKVEVTP